VIPAAHQAKPLFLIAAGESPSMCSSIRLSRHRLIV
jgi:hypothetical protein